MKDDYIIKITYQTATLWKQKETCNYYRVVSIASDRIVPNVRTSGYSVE